MYVKTIAELLERNVEQRQDAVAVIAGDQLYTYAQIYHNSQRIASWLTQHGLNRRDRVGIFVRKSMEELAATLGISMAGGVFVNINSQWTAEQASHIQQDSDINLLVADRQSVTQLDRAGKLSVFSRVLVVDDFDGGHANADLLGQVGDAADFVAPFPVVDADLAALLYTSGSTGKPKGVMVTHRNLLDGARIVSGYLGLRATDRLLSLLPMSFDYGLNQFTCSLLLGATIVLQPVAMSSAITKTIQNSQVTCMAAVPPAWIQLCRYLSESEDSLPSLRLITNSGGKIPDQYLQTLPKLLPASTQVFLMYGLTEAFRSTYLDPSLYEVKQGSMGKAIPNVEIFVVADDGDRLCKRGEPGELVHRGALVSQGYWGKQEATNQRIRSCPAIAHIVGDEKVVYSGDIVREDDDGYLWFVERNDSMIKCSGFRISATEVEEVLYQHEDILEAVAFGAPNEELGAEVQTALRVKQGAAPEEADVLKFCRSRMPSYMIPRKIYFVFEEFPRTASGKIDRPGVVRSCRDTAQ